MTSWRKIPPTPEEWLAQENHGMWWVKFILTEREMEIDEDTGEELWWPEVWYTDCVQICSTWEKDGSERLTARGFVIKDIYLDDPEAIKGLYWQPVAPPLGDTKDKRPVEYEHEDDGC